MSRIFENGGLVWVLGGLIFLGGASPGLGAEVGELVAQLPPLLQRDDRRRVTDREAWAERREELKGVLQEFVYGHLPPRPDVVSVANRTRAKRADLGALEERITLELGSRERLKLRLAVYQPLGEGPYPVIIREEHALGHDEEVHAIVKRGYLFVEYAREDLDPDWAGSVGAAQLAYPDYDWATLAVWAWGGMRVVDYLETRSDVRLDQVGIVGHSRGGKMALLAGGFDTRFALVVANGSGAGGGGSFVIQPEDCETLELITRRERFGYWFHSRLRSFVGQEDDLPFDQHFLKALVAPRALICTDARGDRWANPLGTYATTVAADPVFELLGVPERNAIHFRDGRHDLTPEDWEAILDFADWQFRGREPDAPERFRGKP